MVWFGLVYGDWRRFQQYFSYVVSVSFMGVGNRRKTTYMSRVTVTNLFT
jgi:hypothetical protein